MDYERFIKRTQAFSLYRIFGSNNRNVFICKIYSGVQPEDAYFILCVLKKIGRFKSHYMELPCCRKNAEEIT